MKTLHVHLTFKKLMEHFSKTGAYTHFLIKINETNNNFSEMAAQAKQSCSGSLQAQLFRETDSPKSKASQNTAGCDLRPDQKRFESSVLMD